MTEKKERATPLTHLEGGPLDKQVVRAVFNPVATIPWCKDGTWVGTVMV